MYIHPIKTTANPSDILTKFLPAPAHQEHSKYLNLNTPKPYTQNGNFIGTKQHQLTSTKCSGQNMAHKVWQARITDTRQKRPRNISQKSISPIRYTTKRQRQKQRRHFKLKTRKGKVTRKLKIRIRIKLKPLKRGGGRILPYPLKRGVKPTLKPLSDHPLSKLLEAPVPNKVIEIKAMCILLSMHILISPKEKEAIEINS